jgi:putative IMPACT (imprinted ancient) family translation regulator
MPMLKVLEHSGLGDIVVAVVRYFGGTKLGTGGLQRAYSDAVSQALCDLPTSNKVNRKRICLTFDYTYEGRISRLIERYDTENPSASYAQQVTVSIDLAQNQLEGFTAELVHLTGNQAVLAPEKP